MAKHTTGLNIFNLSKYKASIAIKTLRSNTTPHSGKDQTNNIIMIGFYGFHYNTMWVSFICFTFEICCQDGSL